MNQIKGDDGEEAASMGYYWYGKDYSNCYIKDFENVSEYSRDQFDRTQTHRMPWRDQGLAVFGESARDLARHFIQRWNHAKVSVFALFLYM